MLDVAEPDSGLGHEVCRWRWMLHDYTQRLDPRLHARLEALTECFDSNQHEGVRETWDRVLDCRQLDACLGLLLARAAMLDANDRPSIVQGYVDPLATRAAGSLAWWCRWTLDAWEDGTRSATAYAPRRSRPSSASRCTSSASSRPASRRHSSGCFPLVTGRAGGQRTPHGRCRLVRGLALRRLTERDGLPVVGHCKGIRSLNPDPYL